MITIIIATLCAFFVKGLCGFANTLVFTSILSFGVSNASIAPVELILGYPTNIILTWKNRKNLDHKVYIPLSILVLAGSIPGAFLLKSLDTGIIKIVFGIVVILIGIEMLLRDCQKQKMKSSGFVLFIIGIVAGLLCGLFGVGALLAAYVSRVSDTGNEFKANICAVFIVENTFRIILYVGLGLITLGTVKQVIILVPFMLIGLFLGMKSSTVLDDKVIKKIVIFMLIISGIALIIKNI